MRGHVTGCVQVEDLLRERIQNCWREFSRAIVKSDSSGTGKVYPRELRRTLEKYTLPVSDEHFE